MAMKLVQDLKVGIVEFSVALVALEMGGIGRREKRALVMVKPPGNFGRTGVLEIDDGVFVAVEMGFVKQRSRAMHEAGKDEIGILANALAIEAGEECGGRGSVETLVVIKDPDSQSNAPVPQNPCCSKSMSAHFCVQGKS